MDAEMDTDIVRSPSLDASALDTFAAPPRPAKLDASLFGSASSRDGFLHGHGNNSSGRLPTPMHSTFRLGGVGYPSGGMAGGLNLHPDPYSHARGSHLSALDPLDTGFAATNAASYADNRHLRMPSPICEDEDGGHTCYTPTAITQSQLSRLSVDEDMDLDGVDHALLTTQVERGGQHGGMGMDEEVVVQGVDTTSPTRGRKRSGALSSSKGRFSMGYREDCEKCRMRVPGHYAHFLP